MNRKKETENRLLAEALRSFANLIERMEPSELEKIPQILDKIGGDTKPKIEKNNINSKNQSRQNLPPLDEILKKMSNSKSREEGYESLLRYNLGRRQMEVIARLADVHISKADDLITIREKLVESIVGTPLNARAIRGYD